MVNEQPLIFFPETIFQVEKVQVKTTPFGQAPVLSTESLINIVI